MLLVGLPLHGVPTLVAYRRNHRDFAGVFLLNTFAGWTVVGWVAALARALDRGSARPDPDDRGGWLP